MIDRILETCRRQPTVALFECDGESVSRRDVEERVAARVRALRAAGFAGGRRVAVASGRGGQFWIDVLAVWSAGGSIVPIDSKAAADRRAAMFTLTRPTVLVDGPEVQRLGDGIEGLGASEAATLFTSGSTGAPSAVDLSGDALFGNAMATADRLPIEWTTRLGIAVPFHFTSAICHFLSIALRGGTLVATERKLLPTDFVAFLRTGATNAFGGAPVQVRWLAASDLRLDWVFSSGDRLSTDVIASFRRAHPRTLLYVAYGLTEVGGRLCILNPDQLDVAAGSVGQPIRGLSVTVCDDAGREVGPLEQGEVFADGEYLARGYVADLAKTADRFTRHGLRTGDVGWKDERGLLWLVGRNDDVFKCAGQKIDGTAIVDAIMRSGHVTDAAVLGAPDPVLGAVPLAFIVPNADVESLVAFLRETLPANHLPRRLVTLPAIPRTGSGKVDRSALRRLADIGDPGLPDQARP